MKILNVQREKRGLVVTGLFGTEEFKQLDGNLEHLVVFPQQAIADKCSFTVTGAKASRAKYLLLPKGLRHRYTLDAHDFDQMRCGAVEYGEAVYLIYGVAKRAPVKPKRQEPTNGVSD